MMIADNPIVAPQRPGRITSKASDADPPSGGTGGEDKNDGDGGGSMKDESGNSSLADLQRRREALKLVKEIMRGVG